MSAGMAASSPLQIEPKIVVGLDFGTTFSGFAYAHKKSPNDVHHFEQWPAQGDAGAPAYCKTQTSLLYERASGRASWECKNWGWPAYVDYQEAMVRRKEDLEEAPGGVLEPELTLASVTRFKLLLADGADVSRSRAGGGRLPAEALPPGLDLDRVIADYLSFLSTFALEHLQEKFGGEVTMRDLQWCLTVPAIWNDGAKQRMQRLAERAGMVAGRHCPPNTVASSHKLLIVLEPEAASFFCLRRREYLELRSKVRLGKGDRYMVVDMGGGTTDIVVHEKTESAPSSMRVDEVTAGTGGLAGGAYVDQRFTDMVCRTVGCFRDFMATDSEMQQELHAKWEQLKTTFSGVLRTSHSLRFPPELAEAWEGHDRRRGVPRRARYDLLPISSDDMKSIFDPVVDDIVELVEQQLSRSGDCKAMLLVGGFASSRYVESRLRERFSARVSGNVICPPNPGSAVCYGAVLMGMPEADAGLRSRLARRTYGTSITRLFREGDDSEEHRSSDTPTECDNVLDVFVTQGQRLPVDEGITRSYTPGRAGNQGMLVDLHSTSQMPPPVYTTDPGMVREANMVLDISQALGKDRSVQVTLFFGRSSIEIQARRHNFGDTTRVDSMHVPHQLETYS